MATGPAMATAMVTESRRRFGAVAMGMATVLTGPATALEWTVVPRVDGALTYSDNIDLAPEGRENHGLISQVTPGVQVRADGQRASGELDYALQAIQRSAGRDRGELNHNLNASGEAELVTRTLFIEADASRRQAVSSLLTPIGVDNTTASGNRRAVSTASVSPYLVNRFGSRAVSTLRYTHDRVIEEDGPNSHRNAGSWELASGPALERLDWRLSADAERISGDDDDSGTFRTVRADVGYQLGRDWRVSAGGGYESNDFESSRSSVSGEFWDVGIGWAPNSRTDLELRYGRRFFGETGSVRLQHSRRRTVTTLSYSESVTTTRDDRLERAGTIPVFVGCTPATDPDCEPADEIQLFESEPITEFVVQRRGRFSVNFTGQRNSINVAAFRTIRDFEVRETRETQTGINLNWTLALGLRTTLGVNTGYSRNEFDDPEREDNLANASVSLSRQLSQRVSGRVQLRHQRRDSDEAVNEYRENALTVGLSARF